jgi:anti-sigma B factor antagonist
MGGDLVLCSRREGPVLVFDFSGRLDDITTPLAAEQVERAIQDGERRILLNFTGLNYINSEGLRMLLTGLKMMREREGKFLIACLQPPIKKILQVAGFDRMFIFYDRYVDAIEVAASI